MNNLYKLQLTTLLHAVLYLHSFNVVIYKATAIQFISIHWLLYIAWPY